MLAQTESGADRRSDFPRAVSRYVPGASSSTTPRLASARIRRRKAVGSARADSASSSTDLSPSASASAIPRRTAAHSTLPRKKPIAMSIRVRRGFVMAGRGNAIPRGPPFLGSGHAPRPEPRPPPRARVPPEEARAAAAVHGRADPRSRRRRRPLVLPAPADPDAEERLGSARRVRASLEAPARQLRPSRVPVLADASGDEGRADLFHGEADQTGRHLGRP